MFNIFYGLYFGFSKNKKIGWPLLSLNSFIHAPSKIRQNLTLSGTTVLMACLNKLSHLIGRLSLPSCPCVKIQSNMRGLIWFDWLIPQINTTKRTLLKKIDCCTLLLESCIMSSYFDSSISDSSVASILYSLWLIRNEGVILHEGSLRSFYIENISIFLPIFSQHKQQCTFHACS